MNTPNGAPTINDLLESTHDGGSHDPDSVQQLNLRTEDGYDVYNPSAIFEYEGDQLIAGRVERRDDELNSRTQFFRLDPATDSWFHDESLPSLPLQDPFVLNLHDEWLVGGVRVYPKPGDAKAIDYWETQFYAGGSLEKLKPVFTGPKNMKDIRLVATRDGIGVFTRPQGQKGGLGRVGYTEINSLSELSPQLVYDAPLINGYIAHEAGQWGGVNEARLLPDGRLGVLGHLASFVTEKSQEKYYAATTFIFDAVSRAVTSQQIVACRDCFPPAAESKTPNLRKVVFPGGLMLNGNTAAVSVGVGDASTWQKHIDHPFH